MTVQSAEDPNGGSVSGVAGALGSWYCILFDARASTTVVHELGHALKLYHTFEPGLGTRLIPKGTTSNYMDYISSRNMFFLYQIKKMK